MKIITLDAKLGCAHTPMGRVTNKASQNWVTIQGRPVLVEIDPEGRTIVACPNIRPGVKPCLLTLVVQQGYSSLLRVDGKRVCLDTVTGLTEGTPPGTVKYTVRDPGQQLVTEVG